MAKDTNAQWQDIDVTTLSAELQAKYEAYKVAQRAAAELRTEFESAVNDASDLPQGMKLVFGYRFGKLSAALVKSEDKPKVGAPAKQSLGAYLNAMKASGNRC
jgi:hypothetical protein